MDAGVNPWRSRGRPAHAAHRRTCFHAPVSWRECPAFGMQPLCRPVLLTFRQALAIGGNVKKGEKASIAVFWKMLDARGDADHPAEPGKEIPMLRYYSVFNVEQCEGVDYPKPDLPTFTHDPIAEAERCSRDADPADITHTDHERAYYRPAHGHGERAAAGAIRERRRVFFDPISRACPLDEARHPVESQGPRL